MCSLMGYAIRGVGTVLKLHKSLRPVFVEYGKAVRTRETLLVLCGYCKQPFFDSILFFWIEICSNKAHIQCGLDYCASDCTLNVTIKTLLINNA